MIFNIEMSYLTSDYRWGMFSSRGARPVCTGGVSGTGGQTVREAIWPLKWTAAPPDILYRTNIRSKLCQAQDFDTKLDVMRFLTWVIIFLKREKVMRIIMIFNLKTTEFNRILLSIFLCFFLIKFFSSLWYSKINWKPTWCSTASKTVFISKFYTGFPSNLFQRWNCFLSIYGT